MLPTVWLLGTSGVGKTTVGWRLLQDLGARSVTAAFVDADQLRLASGIAASETDLIAGGLAALDHGYRSAGAELLIVAGLADNAQHLARLLPARRAEEVVTVHLHASDDAVIGRIHQRGWLVGLAQNSVDYARSLDSAWADITLDTTSLSPSEVAAEIVGPTMSLRERSRNSTAAAPSPFSTADIPDAIVVTGPGGSGVSTVGFHLFRGLAHNDRKVGYVDGHQVGFVGPHPRANESAGLRAANTAAVAGVMKEHGVEDVVIAADPPTAHRLQTALPQADTYWLDASQESLTTRLTARSVGGGPPIAGDHRLGLDDAQLSAAIAASLAEARDPALRPERARVVATDSRSPDQIAEAIMATAESSSLR